MLTRLKLGLAFGATLAAICSGIVLIASLLIGATRFGAPGRELDLGALLAVYWGGGLACGVVVGLLLPLARWRAGAAAVGAVAVLPLYGAAELAKRGHTPWSAADVAILLLLGLLVGAPSGWIIWGSGPPGRGAQF